MRMVLPTLATPAVALMSALALVLPACTESTGPSALQQAISPLRGDAQALEWEGLKLYRARMYAGCAEVFEAAVEASGHRRSMRQRNHAHAARCHALAGHRDAAFVHLERALQDGARDAAQLAQERDLTSMHADARWEEHVARVRAADARHRASLHPELAALYAADQSDRRRLVQEGLGGLGPRDAERRARVEQLLAEGKAQSADDFYHAALVFQHGDALAHYQRARQLALEAVARDPEHERARWLAAAAEDRALMHQRKPQRYGTQATLDADGRMALWEVDPSVTDEERARWNVPPLEQLRSRQGTLAAPPPTRP
jgi:hypothetical protein